MRSSALAPPAARSCATSARRRSISSRSPAVDSLLETCEGAGAGAASGAGDGGGVGTAVGGWAVGAGGSGGAGGAESATLAGSTAPGSGSHSCHPSGIGAQLGSGFQPAGGDQPGGGAGQPGGGLKMCPSIAQPRTPLERSIPTRPNGFFETSAFRCSRVASGTTFVRSIPSNVGRSVATAMNGV